MHADTADAEALTDAELETLLALCNVAIDADSKQNGVYFADADRQEIDAVREKLTTHLN